MGVCQARPNAVVLLQRKHLCFVSHTPHWCGEQKSIVVVFERISPVAGAAAVDGGTFFCSSAAGRTPEVRRLSWGVGLIVHDLFWHIAHNYAASKMRGREPGSGNIAVPVAGGEGKGPAPCRERPLTGTPKTGQGAETQAINAIPL